MEVTAHQQEAPDKGTSQAASKRLAEAVAREHAILVALAAYSRWSIHFAREDAIALRNAMTDLGLVGPLHGALGALLGLAREAVAAYDAIPVLQ